MLEGLLLDYGGVMTTSVLASFADFCTSEEIDLDVFRTAVMGASRRPDSPFARVETGAITAEEFDVAVARLLTDACGKEILAAGLKQRMFASVQPDAVMWNAVRSARTAGVRTGMLSNSWGGKDYPLDEFAEIFDAVVISGEVGMRKPNTDIYLHAAKAIGVVPDRCVFVDDFEVNIEGAREAGMQGVLHRDPEETIRTLEDLLGVPLSRPGGVD